MQKIFNFLILHTKLLMKMEKNLIKSCKLTILIMKNLLRSCDIGLSTVVVERAVISKFKFPDMRTKEDFVIWLKIAKKKLN